MKANFPENSISIEKIDFNLRGKINLNLVDGRQLIVPIKYFPELKRLPLAQRKKYTIVDDRTILFVFANSVYHLEDFMGLESKWRER
jgi:hypothetical protein